ncbi:MAG: hypothetical protein Q7T20_11995 [Saprospiraceae bacterium]|nr:hypothetical protein [Saprospiraceae bacterium]
MTVNSLSAQNEIFCGVPDMPRSEYQDILDSIGPMPAGAGSMTFNIPIWFNVLREATPGYLGYSGWETEFIPMQMLSELNGYYSSTGIQFYLCGISQIFSDDFVELNIGTEGSALRAQAQLQNPNYDNVLNIFLATKLQFGATLPGGYNEIPLLGSVGAIYSKHIGSQGARTIAHEIGHYFMLPHTFAWGPIVTDTLKPWLAQYVNDTVTVIVNGGPVIKTCKETGDGFCDTPADPTREFINSYCGWDNCDELIVCAPYPNDPLGVPYNPDASLLMGYSFGCGNRFSDEQTEQMRDIVMAHPWWEFLTDTDEPTCQNLSSSDRGFIFRNCEGVIPSGQIAPITKISIPFKDATPDICGSDTAITNNAGRYLTFACVYPYNGNGLLSVLPNVDHATSLGVLEGVTTYDLTLISKHILAVDPFINPFQIIAADANNNAAVTSFDIVELRKLILGIYSELPNNSSWRYVPDYCFNDSTFAEGFYDPGSGLNPFDAFWVNPGEPTPTPPDTSIIRRYGKGVLPVAPNATSWMDHITLDPNGLAAQEPDAWSFWGIKIGDVNCNAIINADSPEDPDDSFTTIPHTSINTNQLFILEVKVTGDTSISAWQFGVDFAEDTLQIIEIQPGNSSEAFSQDNFGLSGLEEGKFRALNFSENGTGTNLNGKTLFKIKMRSLNPISNIGQRFRLKNSILSKKFYSATGEEIESIDLQLEVSTAQSFAGGNGGHQTSIANDVYNLSTFPVPFSSEIMFDFFLPNDEQIHLSLFDSFGRLIIEQKEYLPKGPQSLRISTLATQPAGLYWYSFEAGTQVLFGKIVKN